MPFEHDYGDSTPNFNPEQTRTFEKSQEAAFRRLVRQAIRKGPFTKSERDITLALFNHWFHHKNGPKSYIHPGRKKLAKKAGVTEKTVSRCLSMLRVSGVIRPLGPLKGNRYKATEYAVDPYALFVLCGCDWVDHFVRNVPSRMPGMSHLQRDKMSHRINNVKADPFQKVSHDV